MAADSFIILHEKNGGKIRVNTHRLQGYRKMGHHMAPAPGTQLIMNAAGQTIEVVEEPEEIDKQVTMAKKAEKD